MRKRKLIVLILCLFLLLPMVSLCEENEVSLSVYFLDGKTALTGAQFDLYRVADMDDSGKMTLAASFKNYPVRVDDLTDSSINQLANTLEGYILRDKIKPAYSRKTDQEGNASFVWKKDEFKPGLFLLMNKGHKQGGYAYNLAPILFPLPYRFEGDAEWNYQLMIMVKAEKKPDLPNPDPIRRKALKVWAGEAHENKRPQEVTVQLLCDGEIYDTQTLNAQNNWGFEWTDLEADHEWSLTEKEINSYRVSIVQRGITFVVTNTYDEGIVLPTPTPEETPEPDPTFTPSPTKTPRPTPTMNPSVLPQTGQMWWPVPVLIAGGLLLIILGLVRRGSDDDEE